MVDNECSYEIGIFILPLIWLFHGEAMENRANILQDVTCDISATTQETVNVRKKNCEYLQSRFTKQEKMFHLSVSVIFFSLRIEHTILRNKSALRRRKSNAVCFISRVSLR